MASPPPYGCIREDVSGDLCCLTFEITRRGRLTEGLARIRDSIVKVVLMNEQDVRAALAKLNGFLDLATITGVCPARVAVSANDQIRDALGDVRSECAAQAFNSRRKFLPGVPRRCTREAKS